MEDFDPTRYGPDVARVLSLDGKGQRLLPLAWVGCSSPEAREVMKNLEAHRLFPEAKEPAAAMAGLWLYFSCFEEAHELAAASNTPECGLWHAILHRQEPDAGNAAYWFRKVGAHPVFAKLSYAAIRILEKIPDAEFRVGRWDPYSFIAFCDRARHQPGTPQERAAAEIQRAEWQILFDYSARQR